MVFFTCLLVTAILYYLQGDGLLFVAIVVICGEMVNLFMTQTATKAIEKKTAVKFAKVVQDYKNKIARQKKTIKDLEDIQEKSIAKVQAANRKIKDYESRLGIKSSQMDSDPSSTEKKEGTQPAPDDSKKEAGGTFEDLPSGSNRKELPI